MLRSNTTRDKEIAKWLWQLGNETGSPINIHADDEFAFEYACENGYLVRE